MPTPLKMNWLALESKQRAAFENLRKDCDGDFDKLTRDQMSATLFALAEDLGESTGRGYPLDWANGETLPVRS